MAGSSDWCQTSTAWFTVLISSPTTHSACGSPPVIQQTVGGAAQCRSARRRDLWHGRQVQTGNELPQCVLCALLAHDSNLALYFSVYVGNICFCLDHAIYGFNYLEGFFYSVYFSVIVYFTAFKFARVVQLRQIYINIIHVLFLLKFWYLLVDGYAIVLSVILTVVGVTYTRKQK